MGFVGGRFNDGMFMARVWLLVGWTSELDWGFLVLFLLFVLFLLLIFFRLQN